MAAFEDFQPGRDQQFVSTGKLCNLCSILPGQLRVLMENKNIRFAMILDGVGYVTVDDAEMLAARCNEIREEIRNAAAKVENAGNN